MENVKSKKLRLKGVDMSRTKTTTRKVKKKKRMPAAPRSLISAEAKRESLNHGGWWIVDSYEKIPIGACAFQHESGRYLMLLESGVLALAANVPEPGKGPSVQQIFTLFKVVEIHFAIKAYNGKYICVNARGEVTATSDAICRNEQFDIAMENGKVAIQAPTGYFLSFSHGTYTASSTVADSSNEIFTLRTSESTEIKPTAVVEEQEDVHTCELNYVKEFHSSYIVERKYNKTDSKVLEKAREEGNMHEVMLDHRVKTKTDRFCK